MIVAPKQVKVHYVINGITLQSAMTYFIPQEHDTIQFEKLRAHVRNVVVVVDGAKTELEAQCAEVL